MWGTWLHMLGYICSGVCFSIITLVNVFLCVFVPQDLPHEDECKEEEDLDNQQVCNQESHSSLDQQDPDSQQTKEEEEEICTSLEGEQLVLKHEGKGILVWAREDQDGVSDTNWKPEINLHRTGM